MTPSQDISILQLKSIQLYLTKGIWIGIHYNYNYIIGTGVWMGQYERLMIKTYIYINLINSITGNIIF